MSALFSSLRAHIPDEPAFLWTSDNYPVAAASFYQWYEPYQSRTAEFVSLSSSELRAERTGKNLWTPSAGQFEWKRLENAPSPAESSKQRLTQMRRLARQFVPELTDRRVVETGSTQQLRLMDQPVYQYRGSSEGRLDGGLFAFVVGTDPEVLLLLEARESADEREWHYAVARMNRDAMVVRYNDRKVWSVPAIEDLSGDRKRHYFIVEIDNVAK